MVVKRTTIQERRARRAISAAHTEGPEHHENMRKEHIRSSIAAAALGHDRIAEHHLREASKHRALAGHTAPPAQHFTAPGGKRTTASAPAPKATQTGKKGGKFVISKSGKKRYI